MIGPQAGARQRSAAGPPAALFSLRRLLVIVAVGIGGNLVYTLLATDRAALAASLELAPAWLLLAALLALAPLVCNALRVWRWGRLLAPGFGLRDAWRVVLTAEVGAAVTPSAAGGAPLKVAALARLGLGTSGGAALAAVGTLEDATVMALAIPAAAMATGLLPRLAELLRQASDAVIPGQGLLVLAGVAAVALALGWLLLRGGRGRRRRVRLRRWWRELRRHAALIRRRGLRVFLGNCLLASLQWSARLSIVTALAAGLGAALEPVRAAVLQWLCFTGMALVPTPGAVGGAEAAFLLVFAQELPAGLLPVTLAAWRLVSFYGLSALALGLLLALSSRRVSRRAAARAPASARPRGRRRPGTATASGGAGPPATRS